MQSFLSVTLGKGNEWQTSHYDQEGRSALAAPSSASSPGASAQHYSQASPSSAPEVGQRPLFSATAPSAV